jgi:hypothetical protein
MARGGRSFYYHPIKEEAETEAEGDLETPWVTSEGADQSAFLSGR